MRFDFNPPQLHQPPPRPYHPRIDGQNCRPRVLEIAIPKAACAASIIGSGTVSNADYASFGFCCLPERRAIEIIDNGAPIAPFLHFGDRVHMEALGGPGAFIGPVHRLAAEMDRRIEMVAGAFSSDPARSLAAGQAYGIDPTRAYPSAETMIASERERADGIQMVVIATPNHLHLSAARAALEGGLAVMSDKRSPQRPAQILD